MSETVQIDGTIVGRRLDHAVKDILINVDYLLDEIDTPDTIRVLVKRPGDEQPYYAQRFTYDSVNKKVKWRLTSTDTARSSAQAEVVFIKGEKVAHGKVHVIKFEPSLGEASDEAPSSYDLTTLVDSVNAQIAELNSGLDGRFDDVYQTISTDVEFINDRLSDLDDSTNGNVPDLQLRMTIVEGKLDGVRIGAIPRIETLEGDYQTIQSAIETANSNAETAQSAASTAQNTAEAAQATANAAAAKAETVRRAITNPNISSEHELRTAASNVVDGRLYYYRYATVETGKTYTFSADVVAEPLEATLTANIGTSPSQASTNVTNVASNVFTINSGSEGRVARTFTASADGFIYFTGTFSGHAKGYQIFDNIQVEEGSEATPYMKYGKSPFVDSEARENITALEKDLKTAAMKYIHGNIVSIADMGYVIGLPPGSENKSIAFISGKKKGFDWVKIMLRKTLDGKLVLSKTGVVNTSSQNNVNVSTVNYSEITEATRPELLSDAINTCNVYGLGMAIEFKYTSTAEDRTYIKNQFRTKNIAHAYMASTQSNLTGMRTTEPGCHVIYMLNSMPSVSDISTSSTYNNLYTASQQEGKTSISFATSGNLIDQDYIDGLNALGISFVLGANETKASLGTYLKYSCMMLSDRYKVEDFIGD